MSVPNYSELVTSTLEKRRNKLADNVTKSSALLFRLQEKGQVDRFDGGRVLWEELEFAENDAFQWYSGWEQLSINPSEVISAAEYDIKECAASIQISGREMLLNSGKEARIKLIKSRMNNAEKTMTNKMAEAVYSDGTGSGGKEIGGMQHIIQSTPSTGTVGSINAANWSFWRNIYRSCTTDGGAAVSSANILSNLNALYVQLCVNGKGPDLAVQDNTFYLPFLEAMQSRQQLSNPKLAEAGFSTLKYLGMDVVLDGGYGGSAPAGTFMLTTDHVKLRPHQDCEYVALGDKRQPLNQHGYVQFIGWMGNVTASCRFKQGRLGA